MKMSPRPETLNSHAQGQPGTSIANAPTKIARILAHLLAGASINRFEAERLGDHCLNSTIAVLANRHDLGFLRQPEKVPNRWGKPCHVIRYHLSASEHGKARKVLALLNLQAKGRKGGA